MAATNTGITIAFAGPPAIGKTTAIGTISSLPVWIKDSNFTLKTNRFGANEELLKFMRENPNVYIGTQRPHTYTCRVLAKGSENLFSRELCSKVFLMDYNGGIFDATLDREFTPDEFEDVKKALTDTHFNKKAIVLFFSLEQIINGCQHFVPGSCSQIKCKTCPFSNGNVFAKHMNRYSVRRQLASMIKLASATDSPMSIAITHCDVPDYKNKIAIAREVMDGFLEDECPDCSARPRYYFVDSISAKNSKGIWARNITYPILDVFLDLMNKVTTTSSGAFHDFVWGSNERIVSEIRRKISNTLEKGRFEGLI